jgi:hypothetical protein
MGTLQEKLGGTPEIRPLLSNEHRSLDGTLAKAGTCQVSLKQVDDQGNTPPAANKADEEFVFLRKHPGSAHPTAQVSVLHSCEMFASKGPGMH